MPSTAWAPLHIEQRGTTVGCAFARIPLRMKAFLTRGADRRPCCMQVRPYVGSWDLEGGLII